MPHSEHEHHLCVSIVTYDGDLDLLQRTVASLSRAAAAAPGVARLLLVDNGPDGAGRSARLEALLSGFSGPSELISGHGNLGYGAGHNLALRRSGGGFHLVLNPDVELAPDALSSALALMAAHPECGLLAPAVLEAAGDLQFLCKRPPSLLDLLLRGFAPGWLRRRLHRRLHRYEMRDCIDGQAVFWDPPIVSGCFMLFRTQVLERLNGFDPRYFLYFEDFDLSLRTAAVARIAYVPAVRVVHHGGGAARKGFAHVRMFARSAVTYFNRHGWRLV